MKRLERLERLERLALTALAAASLLACSAPDAERSAAAASATATADMTSREKGEKGENVEKGEKGEKGENVAQNTQFMPFVTDDVLEQKRAAFVRRNGGDWQLAVPDAIDLQFLPPFRLLPALERKMVRSVTKSLPAPLTEEQKLAVARAFITRNADLFAIDDAATATFEIAHPPSDVVHVRGGPQPSPLGLVHKYIYVLHIGGDGEVSSFVNVTQRYPKITLDEGPTFDHDFVRARLVGMPLTLHGREVRRITEADLAQLPVSWIYARIEPKENGVLLTRTVRTHIDDTTAELCSLPFTSWTLDVSLATGEVSGADTECMQW